MIDAIFLSTASKQLVIQGSPGSVSCRGKDGIHPLMFQCCRDQDCSSQAQITLYSELYWVTRDYGLKSISRSRGKEMRAFCLGKGKKRGIEKKILKD